MRTKLLFLSLALMGGVSAVKAQTTYTFTGITNTTWNGVSNSSFHTDTQFGTATYKGKDDADITFYEVKSFTDNSSVEHDWSSILAVAGSKMFIDAAKGIGVNKENNDYLLIMNLTVGQKITFTTSINNGAIYFRGVGTTGVAELDGVANNAELASATTYTVTAAGHLILHPTARNKSNGAAFISNFTITDAGVESISAPSSISISSYDSKTISFTAGTSTKDGATVTTYYSKTASEYTDENKSTDWTAAGGTTFTYGAGDDGATYYLVSVNDETGVKSTVASITLELTVSVTVGEDLFATYSFAKDLDFESAPGLKAYIASAASEGVVTLTKVGKVQGNQWQSAVLLNSTAEGTYKLSIVDRSSTTSYGSTAAGNSNNYFLSTLWNNSTNGYANGTVSATGGANYTNFILSKENGSIGFYKVKAEGGNSIASGKAYLHLPNTALASEARVFMSFSDVETTNISEVKSTKPMEGIYTLNGVRVAQPTKGLYIVNGKKFVKK